MITKKGFFSQIDDCQNMQQLFNVVSSILICITKSTLVTSYEKIARHGQNLRFHFLVQKWLSLGELLRKKNRKSWKHVFHTNWMILSRKKIFFEKFFLDHSKFSKNRICIISWTKSPFELIFSGMIALDNGFQNINSLFPKNFNFFIK